MLVSGVAFGYLVREKRKLNLSRVVFGSIVLLIFSLGFSIGSDNVLLSILPDVGLQALVIVSLALFFSILFVRIAARLVKLE